MIQEAKVFRVEHEGKVYQFISREKAEDFVNFIIERKSFNNLVEFIERWEFKNPQDLANIIVNNFNTLKPLVEACLF